MPAARPALTGFADADLVDRAREGDHRAFAELVRRWQLPAHRLAVRILGSAGRGAGEDAEDVVQESLLAAWRQLPSFRGESAFSTWLYRIVVNRCLNLSSRRRPATPLDAVADPVDRDPYRSPEGSAERGARLAALHAAVDRLTDDQRACWVLRDIDGLSYEEVAAIVGTTTATVRGRIHRARGRLAQEMRPWR